MRPSLISTSFDSHSTAAEVIDGEAILINLATGMYFSMARTGAAVWTLIEAGHSLEEIASTLVDRYDVDRPRAEADLERLAAELLEHRLVVLSDTPDAGSLAPRQPGDKEAYHPPALTAYRDMGDLLALDPPAPGLTSIPSKPRDASGD